MGKQWNAWKYLIVGKRCLISLRLAPPAEKAEDMQRDEACKWAKQRKVCSWARVELYGNEIMRPKSYDRRKTKEDTYPPPLHMAVSTLHPIVHALARNP